MYSKPTLIFLIVVLVGLVLFLGGYLLSSKDQTANLGNLSRFDEDHDVHPENNSPKLHRLSTTRAISPSIAEDGRQVLFFEAGSGKLLASDFMGNARAIVSGKLLSNLLSAHWAANGYEAIIAQNSRGTILHSYLNVKTGRTNPLHQNISRPSWSPRHDKIAYLFFDHQTNEGQISISNPDGSVFKNILPTRTDQLVIAWPQEESLSFYNQAGENQILFVLNIENKKLDKVFGPVSGLQTLWAPDFSKILLTYLEEGVKKSVLVSRLDKSNLSVELITDTSKCVWSANSVLLYCGVKGAADKLESLYVLDTKTQSARRLFTPFETETIEFKNPLLSPAEDFLIFVNDDDQYLYSISL